MCKISNKELDYSHKNLFMFLLTKNMEKTDYLIFCKKKTIILEKKHKRLISNLCILCVISQHNYI